MQLAITHFDSEGSGQWRRQRCMQRARCRKCETSSPPSQMEQCHVCEMQETRTCFTKEDWAHFHAGTLPRLVCAECYDISKTTGSQVQCCKVCEQTKLLQSFGRTKHSRTYISKTCRACSKRVCSFCGRGQNMPVGQRCQDCSYPRCSGCGRQRPRNGRYHVTREPAWICQTCCQEAADEADAS